MRNSVFQTKSVAGEVPENQIEIWDSELQM